MAERDPSLPADHAWRIELNDEVHARPSAALHAPVRLSYLALLASADDRNLARRKVADLADRHGIAPPPEGANHWSADFGRFGLKWEQHTEFYRCTFILPGVSADPFAEPAISAVPTDWVAALPGELVMAAHVAVLPETRAADPDTLADRMFGGNQLIGATVLDGLGTAYTDFRVHADGFGRFLVISQGMSQGQAGRTVQRLLEIDTYRMIALLALPVARELMPFLARCESELNAITTAMVSARETDEPVLLDRLTRLAAEIESRDAVSRFRFGAALAYDELVQRRIAELREARIEGLQTFDEFMTRRFAPAMNTCRATADRRASLSERVGRATQLLSTRVDISRERQNRVVLEQMNRRAKLQLRLQQTVEGLSVAAITYYVVGLFSYVMRGVESVGIRIDAGIATAVSVPIIALLVAFGVTRFRRRISRAE